MMRFTTLIKHPADWMTGGQVEHGAVLTSRIRLARNLRHHPFPGWAKRDQRAAALDLMRPAVDALPAMKGAFSHELGDLTSVQKQVLVERHLISREHAARGDGSAAVIERRQTLSLMLNEEDHLRMQAIRPGLQLTAAFNALSELDTALEESLEFAFDPTLGYLTTCPTNLGTGLRASAMLHLPALVLSDQIGQVLQAVNKIGLAVRGLYGEGTESLGNLYQISNQSTLGESEETIIRRLERVISQVSNHEQNAREKLFEDDPEMVSDKIGRAYGVLRYAHVINSKEALNHLSLLRLGGTLGFFSPETVTLCDTLLMDIQPAHLQLHSGRKLSPEERDSIRAEIVRARLQFLESPDKDIVDKDAKESIDTPNPSDS
ncbi:MAG: protein arginine kinase [Akkermansiaceae bacterium]|jgi:protein arginine kinase|nr:protein arginine kinase [Akkermansiaceae bacterium]MBJ7285024.1 protein arginine kinase [Akkermansiaceae bacterium]MBJ7396169.1 protein arginine kinase [Akkermansiaceae bacterium]MBJ7424415.1 protein arginine kinase [Akkermansiaceae bacterium]